MAGCFIVQTRDRTIEREQISFGKRIKTAVVLHHERHIIEYTRLSVVHPQWVLVLRAMPLAIIIGVKMPGINTRIGNQGIKLHGISRTKHRLIYRKIGSKLRAHFNHHGVGRVNTAGAVANNEAHIVLSRLGIRVVDVVAIVLYQIRRPISKHPRPLHNSFVGKTAIGKSDGQWPATAGYIGHKTRIRWPNRQQLFHRIAAAGRIAYNQLNRIFERTQRGISCGVGVGPSVRWVFNRSNAKIRERPLPKIGHRRGGVQGNCSRIKTAVIGCHAKRGICLVHYNRFSNNACTTTR